VKLFFFLKMFFVLLFNLAFFLNEIALELTLIDRSLWRQVVGYECVRGGGYSQSVQLISTYTNLCISGIRDEHLYSMSELIRVDCN
jgi:hypothetical protein